MTKKVLFIHHCGVFGGASRSLGELIKSIPTAQVDPIIISQQGTAADYFERLGFTVFRVRGLSKFDITELGYYKGLRWLVMLRELYYFPSTLSIIFKIKKLHPDISLIHINDIQNFLLVFITKIILPVPAVIHIRGPLMKRKGLRYKFLMWTLKNRFEAVIAIDGTVNNSIESSVKSKIIHNGFITKGYIDHHANNKILTIGMVSNLLRFKGVLDFVEAARISKEANMKARFIVLGGKDEKKGGLINALLTIFRFQHDIEAEVFKRIKQYNLHDYFLIHPFREDISSFYRSISVLCFPSHINAVGRPVFEAGFHRVPSIVAISDPQVDAIIHMETGICIQEKNPQSLASAILHFYNNRSEISRMGENALKLVNENYNIYRNAERALEVYNQLMKK